MEAISRGKVTPRFAGLIGAALFAGLLAASAPLSAAPLTVFGTGSAGPAISAPLAMPVTGGCREGCADCNDCPTVIDIVPYPAPPHDDPIAREIQNFPPAPTDPCADRPIIRGRRASHDADACGIRCWYWRLRHGYCGPGCEYYRYRLQLRDRDGIPIRRHPRSACGS